MDHTSCEFEEEEYTEIPSDVEESENLDGALSNLLIIRDNCHSNAKTNISVAQEKQKKQYNLKHNLFQVFNPNCDYGFSLGFIYISLLM